MGIGIHLAEQTLCFLQAALLGAVFGLLYDAFRITRIAVRTAGWVVFLEDVLFFVFCATGTFFFLMRTLDGQLRFFIFIGIGLGWLVYSLSLSLVVMGVSGAIINAVKTFLRLLVRWIFHPIFRFIYRICLLLLRPAGFAGQYFKKSAKRLKYRLKSGRKVVYNQLRKVLAASAKKRMLKDGPQKDKP